MFKWYEESGDHNDVVISSRVRVARNLSKYPFSLRMKEEQAGQIVDELSSKLLKLQEKGKLDRDRKYEYIRMRQLSDVDKVALVERHLLTEAIITKEIPAGAMISSDESVSILFNEEDHVRVQTLCGGMNLKKAWDTVDMIDDSINQEFEYAFHDRLGYLTSFPTNVGTGLRASYMLHLPAIAGTKNLAGIAADIGRFGVALRGIVGERGTSIGNLYQIYNQKTLGQSEQEIMKGLDMIAMQIIKQERRIRNKLLQENKIGLEDSIYRSYGVLKYCRSLGMEEGMNLLSDLQFGIAGGILDVDSAGKNSVYPLMMGIQPANIQKRAGKELEKEEWDVLRAEYIRNNLPEIIS